MKRRPRTRPALLRLSLLVVLLAVAGRLTWRQARQDRLNRALLAAIIRNHTQQVVTLLRQGADANARYEPTIRTILWYLIQYKGRPPKLPASTTALTLALGEHWMPGTPPGARITYPPGARVFYPAYLPENPPLIRALL